MLHLSSSAWCTAVLVVVCPAIVQAGDWHSQVGPEAAPEAIAPLEAPFDMPPLDRPTFPDALFPITDYGAAPGGEVMNTNAIGCSPRRLRPKPVAETVENPRRGLADRSRFISRAT